MIIIAVKLATSITYTADGSQTNFSVPFDYLRPSYVHVAINDAEVSEGFTISNRMVMFDSAPTKDDAVHIYRSTPTTRLVSWADASILKAIDMTIAEVQQLHILEETNDWTKTNSIVLNDEGNAWQGRNYRVSNVSDPTEAQDVVTKHYLDNEEGSFTATMNALKTKTEEAANTAATNAKQAKTSETNAKTSETNANTSKEAAQSAANSASNFATDARSSANEAKSYRDAASTYATNAKNYSENVNVFTPSVSEDGILSWTNKAGLPNPPSVNIKGKDGADGGVTVDAALSDSSTNPVQNKVINEALNNRAVLDDTNTFTSPNRFDDIYMQNGINSLKWYDGSPNFVVGYINSKTYTGNATTATKATQDGAGNVITETYAKKVDVSGVVKSVNGVQPDTNGNVNITVSGGGTNVTVDKELSESSTNPVQNKVITAALNNRAVLDESNIFTNQNLFTSGINLTVDTVGGGDIKWYRGNMSTMVASLNNNTYTGTADKATKDAAGNVIVDTYAKKTDVSGMVKSVNNIKPDGNGNVTITVSGGSNVTVDTTLSATSTNPIANKTVYSALGGKLGKTETAYAATKATQDGDGNTISSTYIKFINGIGPDDSGNVNVSAGGGGVSTSTQNVWTAQQSFDLALLGVEKYTTAYTNGNSVNPSSVTAVYNATGSFTLDLTNFSHLLSRGQSLVFTAYIKANADYPLTITNGGTLKYTGNSSDLAITSAGLLLNIFITLDNSGNKTSIVQASKLS